MKYLLKTLGFEKWKQLVEEELKALPQQEIEIDEQSHPGEPAGEQPVPAVSIKDEAAYEKWLSTNTFEQKQAGFYGVYLKVLKGDIDHKDARNLAKLARGYASDDMRITVNQGLLMKFVRKEALPYLYAGLEKLNMAKAGFDSVHDITVCPGTDTCALGVTNSMGLAKILEDMVRADYPELVHEKYLKVKMSGCMNSCGQHMVAQIGFHGSSIRVGDKIAPAMQVVLGGGVDPDGIGHIAEKIIKVPTRRIPEALSTVLDDYDENADEGEYFNSYFRRQGKRYFYSILKSHGDKNSITGNDFIDWGDESEYVQEIGVGECAGVSYDMVNTIINDAEEKLEAARNTFQRDLYGEAAYHAYTGMVIGSKALLLSIDVACNSQINILKDFDKFLIAQHGFDVNGGSVEQLALQIKMTKPNKAFATEFLRQLELFIIDVKAFRKNQASTVSEERDKLVIDNYYKA